MVRYRSRIAALALGSVLTLSSCGEDAPDRAEVLTELADNTIVPSLEALVADTDELETATMALCESPSIATLDAAHAALAEARGTWSVSEAMWVGPVMERRSWAVIDWPIDAADVEALIADESVELDIERLSRRIAADQRGMGAIEYILGSPADTGGTLDALQDPRRCQYLTGVSSVVATEARLLPADWTVGFEDGGPWIDRFVDPDENGLDQLVNDALFLLEAMADGELGSALGDMGGEPDPDAIVEGPRGLAASDLADHLTGLRLVLVGGSVNADRVDGVPTDGLGPLLGDDLSERLTAAFDRADTAVAAIEGPLVEAVENDPAVVESARQAITEIQTLMATEVVSRLGVTIGFSDADGDSG